MKRPTRLVVIALVLAAIAMVVQPGIAPHLHAGSEAGFYNADHDLTLLATLAGHGMPSETASPVALDVASAPLHASPDARADAGTTDSAAPRAPPAA